MPPSERQAQVGEIIAHALETDPSLKQALDLFAMGQREYLRALSGLRNVTLTSAGKSNPGGTVNAESDSDH